MRSYTYSQGQWHLSKDILPPTALEPHFSSGNAEAQQKWKAFADALTHLGFPTKPSLYTCRLGGLRVFARNHNTLPPTRKATGDTYDFLCLLSFGGTYIRVWITDMRELSFFFTELEARVEDDSIKEIFSDDTLQKMMSTITALADSVYEGYGSVIVKIESSDRR